MGAKRLEDLRAWQQAHTFKLEVYRLMRASPQAFEDFRYRSQVFDAAAGGEANIAEGFYRYVVAEFAHFLAYARSSIGEAQTRLQDGVDRGYFDADACRLALDLGEKALATTTALRISLEPFIVKPSSRRR